MTRALILGLAASTIVFLSAYGGMVSLAQLLVVRRGRVRHRQLRRRERHEGAEARAQSVDRGVVALVITTFVALVLGVLSSRTVRHLLPDADAHVRRDRLLRLRPGHHVLRLRRHHRHRPAAAASTGRCGCTTLALALSVLAYVGFRAIARTPFGVALRRRPRRPDPDGVARLQRPAPPHAGVHAGRIRRGDRRRVQHLVERADRPEHDLDRRRRIDLLIIAVIGGIGAPRGRLARRLCVRRCQQLPPRLCRSPTAIGPHRRRDSTPSSACWCWRSGVSPDGLMGIIVECAALSRVGQTRSTEARPLDGHRRQPACRTRGDCRTHRDRISTVSSNNRDATLNT